MGLIFSLLGLILRHRVHRVLDHGAHQDLQGW